jgi:hypothetical protein
VKANWLRRAVAVFGGYGDGSGRSGDGRRRGRRVDSRRCPRTGHEYDCPNRSTPVDRLPQLASDKLLTQDLGKVLSDVVIFGAAQYQWHAAPTGWPRRPRWSGSVFERECKRGNKVRISGCVGHRAAWAREISKQRNERRDITSRSKVGDLDSSATPFKFARPESRRPPDAFVQIGKHAHHFDDEQVGSAPESR